MQLPSGLKHWHVILSIFPDDIQAVLISLIKRLTGYIQPIQHNEYEGVALPDGIDGLSTRGDYQRLLLSEWALLDDYPDEFTRRAIMQEHLFTKVKRINQDEGKHCVILFDGGPDLLGQPKVVLLALLILLWRRTQLANATFAFGFLQNTTLHNLNTLEQDTINILLSERYSESVTERHLMYWDNRLNDLSCEFTDLWLISGHSHRLSTLNHHTIQLQEQILSQPVLIDCVIKQQKIAEKSITLPLPEAQQCLRIIRNPFIVKQTLPVVFTGTHHEVKELGFSCNGKKLILIDKKQNLYVIYVPHQGQRQAKITRQQSGSPIAAVHFSKRYQTKILVQHEGLKFIDVPGMCSFIKTKEQSLILPKGTVFNTFIYRKNTAEQGEAHLQIRDIKNQLRKLELKAPYQITTIDQQVLSIGKLFSYAYKIKVEVNEINEHELVLVQMVGNREKCHRYELGAFQQPALFIHGASSNYWVAFPYNTSIWHIAACSNQNAIISVTVPDNAHVFGVYHAFKSSNHTVKGTANNEQPVLLVLSENRMKIIALMPSGSEVIHHAEAMIMMAVVNPVQDTIAFICEENKVTFFSINQRSTILSVQR
ncbi:hypothetical protein [Zooshikella harenae]|uniref:Calcineurin-like phosphoesterase domain-containing protein n=1 Tax=Zooshikella harenae TaxID=2827238 RepID=A0ABS5ZH54_9GAMM|nr:hypothetical protein [Zooshikella harenae]MBU2712332.1 hypothetical protein [Zooshikella harenae]